MQEPLQHQLVLEQAAAAAPAQTVHFRRRHVKTDRFTISSLIFPIARVGLSFFGQPSPQLTMLGQRSKRERSSRSAMLSPVAWSRLAAMKRAVGSDPAGRTNLSGLH